MSRIRLQFIVRRRHRAVRAALLALFLVTAPSPRTSASPQGNGSGMDAARLARIPVRMKEFVDQGTIAGAVMLLSRNGVVAAHEAVGYQDLEARKPMRTDSIFQIMSMTKPVVSVGIMMLVEEGRVALSDPVELHLPEFRGLWVNDGEPGERERNQVRPSRPITIRDLLTHTSGMEAMPPAGIRELYSRMDLTLAEAVRIFSQQPLSFQPGTRWQYSNPGIATLGRIIEVKSGLPFERFISERIFQPLGMKDSFVFPPAEKVDRIALVYRLSGGKLERAGADILGGDPGVYRKGARYAAPEFGMYSTASDLAALYQMMLGGGALAGRRIVSRASVELMTALHTGDIEPAGHSPGMGYGLAWTVVRDSLGTLQMNSLGTYGHGGAFGTLGWVDPKKNLIGVFLIQRSSGGNSAEANAFRAMAAAAIID